MKNLNKFKWVILFLILTSIVYFINSENGKNILIIAKGNFISMLLIIPPIYILIGLMDVWIDKEVFIKHMGEKSGIKGLIWAFLLGTIGAGPTYGAFPIATLLIKKGARISYSLFFLGIWSAVKLPIIIFEASFMGIKFTIIHVLVMIFTYLIGAFLIEKLLNDNEKFELIENAKNI